MVFVSVRWSGIHWLSYSEGQVFYTVLDTWIGWYYKVSIDCKFLTYCQQILKKKTLQTHNGDERKWVDYV